MGTFLGNLYASIGLDTSGLKKGAAEAGRTVNGLDKNFKSLSGSILSVKSLITSTGVLFATLASKDLWNTAVMVDQLQRSFKAISGSVQSANSDLDFIRKTAMNLGQEFYSLTESYKFIAAAAKNTALEGKGVRDIFVAVSEAGSALGLTNEQVKMSLYAISQMISKGTVSAEELRQQLGERLPGAYQLMAKALGVTTAELNKMLEQGQLVATDVLPRLAAELHNTWGDAAKLAKEAPIGVLNQFKTAWIDLKVELTKSGFLDSATKSLKGLTETFKDPNVKRGMQDFASNLGSIIEMMAKLAQFAGLRSVTSTFSQAVELSNQGLLDLQEFARKGFVERQKVVDDILEKQKMIGVHVGKIDSSTPGYSEYKAEFVDDSEIDASILDKPYVPAPAKTKGNNNKVYNEYKRYQEALLKLEENRLDRTAALEQKRFNDGLIDGKTYYSTIENILKQRYDAEVDKINQLMMKANADKKKVLNVELQISKEQYEADLEDIKYELAQYNKRISLQNKQDVSRLFQETKDLQIDYLEEQYTDQLTTSTDYYNSLIELTRQKTEEEIALLEAMYEAAGVDEKKSIEIDIIIKKKQAQQEIKELQKDLSYISNEQQLQEYFAVLDKLNKDTANTFSEVHDTLKDTFSGIVSDFSTIVSDGLHGELKSFQDYADLVFGHILDSFMELVAKIAQQKLLQSLMGSESFDWIGTVLSIGSMVAGGASSAGGGAAAGATTLSNGATVNSSGAVFRMAEGGYLGEEVFGYGATSGQSYQFHPNEFVVPQDKLSDMSSASQTGTAGQPITIYNITDPRELKKQYGSSDFQSAVINVMNSNSRKVKRLSK